MIEFYAIKAPEDYVDQGDVSTWCVIEPQYIDDIDKVTFEDIWDSDGSWYGCQSDDNETAWHEIADYYGVSPDEVKLITRFADKN